ncbi:MAG: RNA ligase [Alphaproteobacteria bacterium]|nr:RNA ligase [Alphaproteobacteria bacterium]
MDISRVKFGDELTPSNTGGFEVGDIIQITEKWDGSNASIRYDIETGKLVAFSRRLELSFNSTLNGFWNYVQNLNAEDYKDTPNYVIFGEWGVKNAIKYNPEFYKNWYVYDIYDVEKEEYLPQTEVKKFVEEHGLTYIHVLYEGEFISWEHCQTFCNSPAYGDKQEGIVIKNQTKLNNPYSRTPFVLKIVNERFSEIKKDNRRQKIEDPQKIKEKEHAQCIVDMVVTKRRVEKELYKMRDEGIVPEKIEPEDMRIVAQNLPKRIYADCLKEERELVESAGEYFGKMCGSKAMFFAKELILGN